VKRSQYIWILVIVHLLVGLFLLHKLYSVDICEELAVHEHVITQQDSITHNVDERLRELSLAMDSASMLGEEILEKKHKLSLSLKRKNESLDMENEQLSNAVRDLYGDTFVIRDTVHIHNNK
jgi:hypothetical protein